MRLWHYKLISYLPRQQLLGQHRECAALRGKGWGRKHATVDYVFRHSPNNLIAYHLAVMAEMEKRGYKPDSIWKDGNYRGKVLGYQENWSNAAEMKQILNNGTFYEEHNDVYLKECLENLANKNIQIDFDKNI